MEMKGVRFSAKDHSLLLSAFNSKDFDSVRT